MSEMRGDGTECEVEGWWLVDRWRAWDKVHGLKGVEVVVVVVDVIVVGRCVECSSGRREWKWTWTLTWLL